MSRQKKSTVDYSWLDQFETDGPFLSLPVVKSAWPTGVDRIGNTDGRTLAFKQAYADWLKAYDERATDDDTSYAETTHAWIETVLDDLAEWDGLRLEPDALPHQFGVHSPGEQIRIRPQSALEGRDSEIAALVRIVEPSDDLRGPGLDGWSATEIDRMAALLREAQVEIGIVTDGRWWAIVWAHRDKPTGSAITDAATWGEEPLVRDAFITLINQRRFRAKDADERLPQMLERSELEAEQITEALGTQVRKAVELLVGAFSRARLEAQAAGDHDPLPEQDDEVYQAAVTVMMRVVFLLFAEERGMLPTEKLYWDSYAIRDVLNDLQKRAAEGEEHLDETYDTWHRLLAVSEALYGGVNYDEMRTPAYGGSLLDPERFPWLSATHETGLRIKVRDRVMLHVLSSVQYAYVGKEARRISFRDIDVEQIGYIYEGLLGYTCTTVEDEVLLGLNGKVGEEPEIDVATLGKLNEASTDGKAFAKGLRDWVKGAQSSAKPDTVARIAKAYDAELNDVQRAEVIRQLRPIVGDDSAMLDFLVGWSGLIRRDLRGIPFVVPRGGLVVTETPSRKHAGAHYTPRSLAEEVVQHTLEPLVYEPGPHQENDRDKWRLKESTAILDLKVADIAAGSGAFLVAAARFLAARVVEAWSTEGTISVAEEAQPDLVYERAIREVVARCLYGADINPMAVEMCKLSLWLVSLDPTKPFSFVDDKIFCGNSLLGVTKIKQLTRLHIHPEGKSEDLITELVDVDSRLTEATRLRRELASPVVEEDPTRSQSGKERLLRRFKQATSELRDIGDGVIAAGLPHGGKPGSKLDDAYASLSWSLGEAFPRDGSVGDRSRLDRLLKQGLTPTVMTDYERWSPMHWAIEAPDVMRDHGGFDAVVGNPPFLGSNKIPGAIGTEMHDWYANVAGCGTKSKADMVAFFVLQILRLINRRGTFGLIATNTLAQGDTRDVALNSAVATGWTLTRAVRSQPWPASAGVSYSAVWGARSVPSSNVLLWCDGIWCSKISTLLEPAGRAEGTPMKLKANSNIAYNGCYLLGTGFVVSRNEAQKWISEDPESANVVVPYLTGEDLNSRPDQSPRDWVIDFDDRDYETAGQYSVQFERVHDLVKPVRDMNNRKAVRERWWQYAEKRPGMRRAVSELSRVVAVRQSSSTLAPSLVEVEGIFDQTIVVFAEESPAFLALLSSSVHQLWVMKNGLTLGTGFRYTPSDVFDNFPRPYSTVRLAKAGRTLDEERRVIMQRRELGLTSLYNLVNDPIVQDDPDVDRVREIHVEVDEATMESYGWHDLPLEHGFHTYRQMERWSVSPAARLEILDRLVMLNHEYARDETCDVPNQDGLF